MIDLTALESYLAQHMDSYRYAHTLSVKEECMILAFSFGLSKEDTNDLLTAALLHDCTKGLTYDEQLELADEMNLTLSEEDLCNPKVLHSITGAALAVRKFNVSEKVANMIACHTTGKEDMTLSEKLLYLADYIESTRMFKDCITLRRHFYEERTGNLKEHLDRSLILSFDMTIRNLLDEGYPIHTQTIKSRNFLLKNA